MNPAGTRFAKGGSFVLVDGRPPPASLNAGTQAAAATTFLQKATAWRAEALERHKEAAAAEFLRKATAWRADATARASLRKDVRGSTPPRDADSEGIVSKALAQIGDQLRTSERLGLSGKRAHTASIARLARASADAGKRSPSPWTGVMDLAENLAKGQHARRFEAGEIALRAALHIPGDGARVADASIWPEDMAAAVAEKGRASSPR